MHGSRATESPTPPTGESNKKIKSKEILLLENEISGIKIELLNSIKMELLEGIKMELLEGIKTLVSKGIKTELLEGIKTLVSKGIKTDLKMVSKRWYQNDTNHKIINDLRKKNDTSIKKRKLTKSEQTEMILIEAYQKVSKRTKKSPSQRKVADESSLSIATVKRYWSKVLAACESKAA